MKTRMIIMQGISGSGKSTEAKVLAAMDENAVIVSRDTIRESMLGKQGLEDYFEHGLNFEIEEEVTKAEHLAIVRALLAGKNVIIDNTNLRRKYVIEYCKLAKDCSLSDDEVVMYYMDEVSVDEAYERIQKRGERLVSRNVLERQHEAMHSGDWTLRDCWVDLERTNYQPKAWFSPPFEVEPYYQRWESARKIPPTAVICDIDGTLAHRALLEKPFPHFRSFYNYEASNTDEVDFFVLNILLGLRERGTEILFVSGRKTSGRKATEEFLNRVFPPTFKYKLFMRDETRDLRPNGRDASDDVVKYRIFNEEIRGKYHILGVLDDRKRVVALWETLGLRVANMGLLNEVF